MTGTPTILGLVLAVSALASGSGKAGPLPRIDLAPASLIVAADYSASGTHQCRTEGGETHSCVVTGLVFGNCIDAAASLRTQDCCPSTRTCARDSQGRETQCRRGGASAGFSLNYCIPGTRL